MIRRKIVSLLLGLFIMASIFLPNINKTEAASSQYLIRDLMTNGNDVYNDRWNSSESFIDTTGKVISIGVGFAPYYSSTYNTYADFFIGDYKYTTLETRLSLTKRDGT